MLWNTKLFSVMDEIIRDTKLNFIGGNPEEISWARKTQETKWLCEAWTLSTPADLDFDRDPEEILDAIEVAWSLGLEVPEFVELARILEANPRPWSRLRIELSSSILERLHQEAGRILQAL